MGSLDVVNHVGRGTVQGRILHVMSCLLYQHVEEALVCCVVTTVLHCTH